MNIVKSNEYVPPTPILPKLDQKWLPPTSALSSSKDPIARQRHWSFSERWNKAIWSLTHPTAMASYPVGSKRWLQSSHLTPECCLRRSLHFFSSEFSGCFLGDDILDDGIIGCLEGDVLNNRLSLQDMMVRDGSINKIYIRLGWRKWTQERNKK